MRTVRFELLRPAEIVAERERCPVAYLPVGPLEWHSLHMPLGVDALNAGEVARRVAQRVGGVVLPTLYWGTERERPPDMAEDLGFGREEYVVGMDFPGNVVKSLYCPQEILALLVRERLNELLPFQYKLIVIVNGHGAANQIETLRRLAIEYTARSPARVLYTVVCPADGDFDFGFGHADVGETSAMMALYPESVDLSALPALPAPLRVPELGITDSDTFRGHPTPDHTLPASSDPRLYASPEVGRRIVEQTAIEIAAQVRAALDGA